VIQLFDHIEGLKSKVAMVNVEAHVHGAAYDGHATCQGVAPATLHVTKETEQRRGTQFRVALSMARHRSFSKTISTESPSTQGLEPQPEARALDPASIQDVVDQLLQPAPADTEDGPPAWLHRKPWRSGGRDGGVAWMRNWCALRGPLLLHFATEASQLHQGAIVLAGAKIHEFRSLEASEAARALAQDYPYGFEVVSTHADGRRHFFHAPGVLALRAWMDSLRAAAEFNGMGYMWRRAKRKGGGAFWKRRWFVYCRASGALAVYGDATHMLSGQPKHVIDLHGVKLRAFQIGRTDVHFPYGFVLYTPKGTHVMHLSTLSELRNWMHALAQSTSIDNSAAPAEAPEGADAASDSDGENEDEDVGQESDDDGEEDSAFGRLRAFRRRFRKMFLEVQGEAKQYEDDVTAVMKYYGVRGNTFTPGDQQEFLEAVASFIDQLRLAFMEVKQRAKAVDKWRTEHSGKPDTSKGQPSGEAKTADGKPPRPPRRGITSPSSTAPPVLVPRGSDSQASQASASQDGEQGTPRRSVSAASMVQLEQLGKMMKDGAVGRGSVTTISKADWYREVREMELAEFEDTDAKATSDESDPE